MIISSTSNPQVKMIRKLRERKTRQDTGLFYIEGLRIIGEAVERSARVQTLVICPQLLVSDYGKKLLDWGIEHGVNILEVSEVVFRSFSLKEGPQGIGAVVYQDWTSLNDVSLDDNSLWVALDAPQDPGNVGTILRTLDSVGGKGVILLDSSTDPYDPTSTRASMGSIFNLKLIKTSFEDFIEWRINQPGYLIGTSGQADIDYHYFAYSLPMVLLMGSERMGLQSRHLSQCDQIVQIPMVGKNDSLNLAVSTAVILYEIYNKQRDIPNANVL